MLICYILMLPLSAIGILKQKTNKQLSRKRRKKLFGSLYPSVNLKDEFASPLNRYQYSLFLVNRLVLVFIPVIFYQNMVYQIMVANLWILTKYQILHRLLSKSEAIRRIKNSILPQNIDRNMCLDHFSSSLLVYRLCA